MEEEGGDVIEEDFTGVVEVEGVGTAACSFEG